jgi:hypothetical protein
MHVAVCVVNRVWISDRGPARRGRAGRGLPKARARRGELWVPKTYATRRYSWMTPPARSCRRTRK